MMTGATTCPRQPSFYHDSPSAVKGKSRRDGLLFLGLRACVQRSHRFSWDQQPGKLDGDTEMVHGTGRRAVWRLALACGAAATKGGKK